MDSRGGTGELSDRWRTVGTGDPIRLRAVGLWLVDLPFLRPVATARGIHHHRSLVMVQVMGTVDGRPVEGWGECAALADSTYDREDTDTAFRALEEVVVPELFAQVSTRGLRLPPPSELDRTGLRGAAAPLAFAALEMAVADVCLRAEVRSLAGLLGVEDHRVELGAVVGMVPSVDELVTRVKTLADEGYRRVKLKIGPGWDLDPLDAVTRAVPSIGLQADGNGSYSEADADHLLQLDRFGLLCLEQPFERDALGAHARLAVRMRTPICLDESIDSPAQVATAIDQGACSVVCVKPGRLGGLGAALRVVDACTAGGIPLWMGGMFESGFARGVNTTVAALPGFAWPGDLSPARSYLEDDLVPASPTDSARSAGPKSAAPPRGIGLGPPPDSEALERRRSRFVLLEAPGA